VKKDISVQIIYFFIFFSRKWILTILGNVKRQTCTNFLPPNCIKIAKQLKKVHVILNCHSDANLLNLLKENFCTTPQHGYCKCCFNLPTFFKRKLWLLKYSFEFSLSFPLFSNQQLYLNECPSNLRALTSAVPVLFPPVPFRVSFLSADTAANLWSREGKLVGLEVKPLILSWIKLKRQVKISNLISTHWNPDLFRFFYNFFRRFSLQPLFH